MLEHLVRPLPGSTPTFVLILTKYDQVHGKKSADALPGKMLVPTEDLADRLPHLIKTANEHGQHLYYRPAIRDSMEKVVGSNYLWADIDHSDDPKQLERLKIFLPKATHLYWSGGNYHALWALHSPITDLKVLEAKQLGLCGALHADPIAAAVKQGLRVPGSVNWKYVPAGEAPSPAHYVQELDFGTGTVHAIDLFPMGVAKKKGATGPASWRELFSKYFPDYPEQEKEEWLVPCPLHDSPSNASLCINVAKGVYNCKSDRCGAKGTALDFYRRMEHVTWQQAKSDCEQLQTHSSLVDLMEDHLRSLCTPLYRDGPSIFVAKKTEDGGVGSPISFTSGSNASIKAMLFVIFDGSPAAMIAQAIGDQTKSMKETNDILSEACLQLGHGLPLLQDIQPLAQGNHFVGGKTLQVEGLHMRRWVVDHWEIIPDAIYDGKYIMQSNEGTSRPWYPRTPKLTYTPKQLLGQLVQMLQKGWAWEDPYDAWLMALYTLYLPGWHLFGTPIHLQVCGPSQSGKSRLTGGWFSGHADDTVGMAPGTRYHADVTAAHLHQIYDHATLPVVLDEVLDHEDFRAKALTELVRNMESGGSPVARGTADGKRGKQYHAVFPTIWSSIKIPDLIQDVNRRLYVEFKRVDPPPPDPWQAIAETWSREDLHKASRAVADYVPTYQSHLLDHLQTEKKALAKHAGSGYRMMLRILPLLAIARHCEMDTTSLMKRLISRIKKVEDDTRASSPSEALRYRILNTPLHDPAYTSVAPAPLSHWIASSAKGDVSGPSEGIFYWRKDHVIGIVPSQFALRDNHKSVSCMSHDLKNLPGFLPDMPDRRRINGMQVRCVQFDAGVLMRGGDADEAIEEERVGAEQPSNGKPSGILR